MVALLKNCVNRLYISKVSIVLSLVTSDEHYIYQTHRDPYINEGNFLWEQNPFGGNVRFSLFGIQPKERVELPGKIGLCVVLVVYTCNALGSLVFFAHGLPLETPSSCFRALCKACHQNQIHSQLK